MSHWDQEISIWGPLNFPFNSCSSSPNGPFNPFNPRSAKPRTRAPLPAEVLGNLELLGPSRSSGPWRQPRAILLRPPTEKPSWVWREALEGSRGQRQSPLHPLSHAEELLRVRRHRSSLIQTLCICFCARSAPSSPDLGPSQRSWGCSHHSTLHHILGTWGKATIGYPIQQLIWTCTILPEAIL